MTLEEAVQQVLTDFANLALQARRNAAIALGPFVGRVIAVHGLVWQPREIIAEVRRQLTQVEA